MQNKLGLGAVPDPNEHIKNGISTRSIVLMILDKLYSIFKTNQLNGISQIKFCASLGNKNIVYLFICRRGK